MILYRRLSGHFKDKNMNLNWIKINNNSKISLLDIPVLDISDLRIETISLCGGCSDAFGGSKETFSKPFLHRLRPVGFFGKDWGRGDTRLFVVLADDSKGVFYVSSALFKAGIREYDSFTSEVPAFHMFEREFFEEFNIKPVGHPWLKPERKNTDNYQFFEMDGEEVHRVAVGPIHAGVIEPGHFRFMCNGETVYHLEIALGYQHRGVEDMMVQRPSNRLAESVCGDSVIAYNLAYSKLMESVKGVSVSSKAQLIRLLALEMERAAIHIGDLGAIAGDIAYLMGASVFGATRTLVINTMLEFSGSRFGRGLITIGGVNFDIEKEKVERAKKTFDKVERDVKRMVKTMLKNSSVVSRLEKTGTVNMERALEIGMSGLAARASGINIDSRFDFPDKWYAASGADSLGIQRIHPKGTGDVNARFKIRYKEILQSFSIIRKAFEKLEDFAHEPVNSGYEVLNKENAKDVFAISAIEGWRGEIIHIAMTDGAGRLSRYKIKDPSFNNWYGLALAVRNNGVSDFPLCNKSFNLSYCGCDL